MIASRLDAFKVVLTKKGLEGGWAGKLPQKQRKELLFEQHPNLE